MAVEVVSRDRAAAISILSVGRDPAVLSLGSSEVLAEVIRRTASFVCPATQRNIIKAARDPLEGLITESTLTERLQDLIRDLINAGDLLELPTAGDDSQRLLYLAQPAFVRRGGDRFMVVGVRAEGAPFLEGDLAESIHSARHLRFISLDDLENPEQVLRDHGLRELTREEWLHGPRSLSPQDFVRQFDERLEAEPILPVDLADVRVLDTGTPVTYYRGRWRGPAENDEGRFVARRPQAYGAELWAYLELRGGVVARLIDLPLINPLARGCDEAWRLQAALDRLAGDPQVVRISDGAKSGDAVLSFFGPLPSWAQRRLDLLGTPVDPQNGALLSYSLNVDEAIAEIASLEDLLWMVEGSV